MRTLHTDTSAEDAMIHTLKTTVTMTSLSQLNATMRTRISVHLRIDVTHALLTHALVLLNTHSLHNAKVALSRLLKYERADCVHPRGSSGIIR